MKEFSQSTIEKIGFYVYILVNPQNNKIFYVGKGKGNRIFDHINCEIDNQAENEKFKIIEEIKKSNKEVKLYIVRHGSKDEKIAYEIEATLIDLLTHRDFKHLSEITNILAGHYTWERGIKTVEEIEQLYTVEELTEVKHNLLIININKTYNPEKEKNLYEATRKSWRLNEKNLEKIDFVLAEYKGIVRAIFKPEKWYSTEDKKRKYFEGKEVMDEEIKKLYLNKRISKKGKGQQNPIFYLWKQ